MAPSLIFSNGREVSRQIPTYTSNFLFNPFFPFADVRRPALDHVPLAEDRARLVRGHLHDVAAVEQELHSRGQGEGNETKKLMYAGNSLEVPNWATDITNAARTSVCQRSFLSFVQRTRPHHESFWAHWPLNRSRGHPAMVTQGEATFPHATSLSLSLSLSLFLFLSSSSLRFLIHTYWTDKVEKRSAE